MIPPTTARPATHRAEPGLEAAAGRGAAEPPRWSCRAGIAGLRQILAQATDPAAFRSTGFEPAILLALDADRRPGWYEIAVAIEADQPVQVRVCPGFGGEPSEARSTVLKRAGPALHAGTFKAPAPFRTLRIDPVRVPCSFRIGDVRLDRLGPLRVLAMAIAGARRAARRGPRALARFLAAALATAVRPGRFETFQTAERQSGPEDDDPDRRYRQWIERFEPHDETQRGAGTAPVAVLVPVVAGPLPDPAGAVAWTLASLLGQTETPAEIVLAAPRAVLAHLDLPTGGPVRPIECETDDAATAAGAALAASSAPYVLVLAPADIARPRMVAALAAALQAEPAAVLAHGDEDRIGGDGARRAPRFKPRWSPTLLEGRNYLGRPVLVRRAALLAAGGFRPGFPGAEDWDLALRVTSGASGTVVRVAEVLASRTELSPHSGFTAVDEGRVAASGRRVLEDHFARLGRPARVEPLPGLPGVFRARRGLPSPAPKVTVIMPTRDRLDLLAPCVRSVLEGTDYPDLELLIVDNGSDDPATLAFLGRLAADPRTRLLRHPGPFDYAAINNAAAAAGRGEILCLLNNDVEAIEPGWLAEMVSLAVLPGVGPVGAKLLYPDRTIQHAGIVLGMHGSAGHVDVGAPADAAGWCGRLRTVHEVSAVTGACLVVRRDLWRALGGLDPIFPIAFNDLDFCLRAARAGHRTLFTPHAVLVHKESASRGRDATPEKRARYRAEAARFKARWGPEILDDPYVSPNLDRAEGRWLAQG